jgi:hypothetical protein
MTPQRADQIRSLIANDPIAKSLFDNGRYGDCAVRLCEIATPITRSLTLSKMGIVAVYRDNPMLAMQVLAALESASKVNPIIAVMLAFMGPGNPENSYPDFGDPIIRDALTAPQPQGLGLTSQQAAPLLAAGEQADTISGLEVEQLAEGGTV